MLINKLLLEHRFMIVRSTDLNYLRYIMDFGLIPIVRWIPGKNIFIYVRLVYGDNSLLKKESIKSQICPLNISEIKDFLSAFTEINKYELLLLKIEHAKIMIQSCLGGTLYINRNDLLC